MPVSQMDRPLLATLAFCVLALGAWALNQEATQYLAVGTRIKRVAALPEHAPFPGLSLSTRQDNLRDCVFALRRQGSLEVRYVSEEFRAGLPARCAAMAAEAVELMPTYSYGWFALAYTDALAGNWDAMNEHLHMSQVTGRASQWVAEQRVAVAESYRGHLDARSFAGNDADLRMLVLSRRGIGSIAARYINDPTFRERITMIVETMPEDVQRRFIGALRFQTR
jgi:hypothetical protein